MAPSAVIVSVARTALGRPRGVFRDLDAGDLGRVALGAALARGRLPADEIDAVCLASEALSPETRAMLQGVGVAGVPCEACGPGLMAVVGAVTQIDSGGRGQILVAGSVSTGGAPMRTAPAGGGEGDVVARRRRAWEQARAAAARGDWTWETVPVPVTAPEGMTRVEQDELDDVAPLASPPGADGAAAIGLLSAALARTRGLRPLATVVGHTVADSVLDAEAQLLQELGWSPAQVDLWEIEGSDVEARRQALAIPPERINVLGGAEGLGHLGAADALRRLVSLVGALRRRGGLRGVVSASGPLAAAVAIELEGGVACGARRR